MEQQSKSTFGIHSGSPFFLAGLLAGAGIGLLLAPRSGAATRRAIGQKAGEGMDLLKAGASAGRDYINSCGTELRELVKEASGPKTPAPGAAGLTA